MNAYLIQDVAESYVIVASTLAKAVKKAEDIFIEANWYDDENIPTVAELTRQFNDECLLSCELLGEVRELEELK